MNIKYFVFVAIAALSAFVMSCEVQQASYERTGVGGYIYDSATKAPITGASINVAPDNITVLSDSAGNYYVELNPPSSGGNYVLTVSFDGYRNATRPIVLWAGDTTARHNFAMFSDSQQVYINYNILVKDYVNGVSFSALDLYNLAAVQDTIWTRRDARFRASDQTNTIYKFLTGWDYTTGYGYKTRFSNPIGTYTQSEFDTLSTIFGGRPIDPNGDFPSDFTNDFNIPSSPNMVYCYYLLGRNNYYGDPKVFGLIRIADAYYDTNLGLNVVVVDLKVNRKGNNYFNLH
ncbi:MAG TPA: carboxypeptidase-like regulatory domain-containing protein [Ignavibacteria bacterium]|nr:carboxypeptidase-like regulatory domain-containing protein [Ignavibacteria bacterium]